MPYLVRALTTLAEKGRIEDGLNDLEAEGWTLVNVVPGYLQALSGEAGTSQSYPVDPDFIFYKKGDA